MSIAVIANIISFCAGILMVLSGVVKRKNNVIIIQTFQNLMFASANLMLGGVSGFIVNILTILRNVFCLKREFTLPWKIAFILAPAALSIRFNGNGLIGWLPVIGAALFTWFLDTKNDKVIKIVCIIGQIMWGIFDFYLMNYSAFAFDVLTLVTNTVGIIRLNMEKKAAKEKTAGEA